MSNIFDAVAQVYEYIQVPDVSVQLDGRIYQHQFPTEGELIGEGKDRFIVINTIEPKYGQIVREVTVNIQVFVREKPFKLMDIDTLDSLEKAIDVALDVQAGSRITSYGAVEKITATVLPENPFSKSHTLMVIRLNLIINAK